MHASRSVVVAYISGHGFGHATRAAAVLDALLDRLPGWEAVIKTTAPAWLFWSLGPRHTIIAAEVDAAPVHENPFTLDLEATLRRMATWLHRQEDWIRQETRWLADMAPGLVLADISPLALAAAHRAGIPSALVANFTWEWILRRLPTGDPRAGSLADRYEPFTRLATWCFVPWPGTWELAHPYPIPVGLIGRRCPLGREDARARLGLPPATTAALLTFGGLDGGTVPLAIPGGTDDLLLLSTVPRPSLPRCFTVAREVPHACLVQAADVVVGKLGYSTVAESLIHGTPFLVFPRPGWPEEDPLFEALSSCVPTARMTSEALRSGEWLSMLRGLAAREHADGQPPYGADQIALVLAAALRP